MVFVGSRHCQHCGATVKSPRDREAPPLKCPRRCGDMRAVRFGGADMWECVTCSGLWIDRETVERLIAERLKPAPLLGTGIPRLKPEPLKLQKVTYAACPQCEKLMNRLNFARTSGIIVDVCGSHGTWFDADELRRVVEFVAAGGLEAARARELAEAREQSTRLTPVEPTLFTDIGPVSGALGESRILHVLVSYVRSRTRRTS